MINVSKARNHAILNATSIRAPIFCTRNRHLIVRKSRCISHFVFSTGISSPLSFFFYFFSFISQKHDARPAGTKSGAVLLLRLLLLPLLASIVPLSPIMHSLSLSLSLLFLFLLLSFSFLCFVRVAIQYLFTHAPIVKTASLGLWRITVSRSIYDPDCSQSAIVFVLLLSDNIRDVTFDDNSSKIWTWFDSELSRVRR